MRHVVNSERRSLLLSVDQSFRSLTSDRDAVRTEGETIGAPSRRILEFTARNIALDPKFGSFVPAKG